MSEIIFQSDRLLVRYVPGASDEQGLTVTFDAYHDDPGYDRPGFAENILRQAGVPAIHFLSATNDWFQMPEIHEAVALAAKKASGRPHVLVTGASMGGYAALRFARALGADSCVAFSPQYSVDPRVVPFEVRWREVCAKITFLPELNGPIGPVPNTLVVYDSAQATDRRQLEYILAEIDCRVIAAPHGDHAVAVFINEIGLLEGLIRPGAKDDDFLEQLKQQIRQKRKGSLVWLGNLALAQPPHRAKTAIAIARRAAQRWPDHPLILDRFAIALRNGREFEEAAEMHRRALSITDAAPYLWNYSKTLHLAGNYREALEVTRRLQERLPDLAGYHWQAARLEAQLGQPLGAVRDMARAISAAPKHGGYWMLFTGLLASAIGRSVKNHLAQPR